MGFASKQEIAGIKPVGDITSCPSCDYKDGFHVSFLVPPETQKGEVFLICPNCHRRFRIGWQVTFDDRV